MAGSRCGHANLEIRRQGPSLLLQLDRCSSRRARAGWMPQHSQPAGRGRPPLLRVFPAPPLFPDAAAEVLSEGRPPCHQPASRYELLYASEGERAQPPASVQRRSEQAAAPAALTQHARCSNAHHRYYRVHVWATDSRHFHHPHLHITASLSRSSLMLSACPQQSARPCRPLVVHEEVRVLPSLLT